MMAVVDNHLTARALGGVDRAGEDPEHAAALARAERLILDVQEGRPLPSSAVGDLIREAEERGWGGVARTGVYTQMIEADLEDDEAAYLAGIERALERGLADGDGALAAVALARRARLLTRSDNPSSSVAAGRDLARASVLLEGVTEGDRMLARAHINCAIAYGQRDLWELEDEHYRAADKVLSEQRIDGRLRHVIRYNHAEMQLNWACALRELGEADAVQFRARAAARALSAADVPGLPSAWREELRVFATLLAAIAPGAVPAPAPPTGEAQARHGDADDFEGHLHLARALTLADREDALLEAQLAIAAIDPDSCQNTYNLALSAAAEIESEITGAQTAGLGYARHLARLRWATRLSGLAAMQSLLQAERLSTEHALLSQHAYLDDLTRLSNRRGMARYVDHLAIDGTGSVAMILIDVDRFKEVNDRYGHAVGDQVLIRLAGLLRAAVRADDLAVRLGGDEFVLLLADTQIDAVRRRAEAIVAAVEAEPWEAIAPGLEVRASVGAACGDPAQLERVSGAADGALYRSKAAGGGCYSEG